MSKANASAALPWIRTKDAIRLISDECGGDLIVMNRRLLDAFKGDLVRCQAGNARFDLTSGSDLKWNWSVPRYVWQQKGGHFLLAADQFTTTVDVQCSAALAKDFGIVSTTSVTLLELKIHEAELRKHFQLPARPKRSPKSKRDALKACKEWLPKEFEKDEQCELRKDDFAEMALARYDGRLNGRGFKQVWKEVTANPAYQSRAGGGRRKGT